MGTALAESVIERHAKRLHHRARLVTIDLDPTDDPTHGAQQLSFFNSHYGSACYLPMMGFVTFLAAMRRMGIDKDEMSGHGFRAVARTILDEVLGVRPDYIAHQLVDALRAPPGRPYNRTAFLPERRKMMQPWADYRTR